MNTTMHDPELLELAELARSLGATASMVDSAVSGGVPIPTGVPAANASTGAAGPGGQMNMIAAVLTVLGVGAAGLIGLRLLFGKGKLPPVRVDAVNALNIYWSWLVIDGTLKLVAYKFHGHKVAQAYLLIA